MIQLNNKIKIEIEIGKRTKINVRPLVHLCSCTSLLRPVDRKEGVLAVSLLEKFWMGLSEFV